MNRIRQIWLICDAINYFLFVFFNANTIVYIYKNISITHKAYIDILDGALSLITVSLMLNKSFRRRIITHPIYAAITGSFIDGITELFLIVNPFIKLIFDVVAFTLWMNMYRHLTQERKNTIFQDPDVRTTFDLLSERYIICASILGGLCAVYIQPPVVPLAISSALSCVFSYFLSAWRFIQCDEYAKKHGLIYPCLKSEDISS